MTQPQRQLSSQHPKQHHQNFTLSSCTSASISKSNTKFIIRYEEKQLSKSGHKINRYSSKLEHELIRSKKISESVLQKTKIRNKDGYLPSYLKPTQASISAQLDRNRVASVADMSNQNKIGLVKMRSKSLEEEDQQGQREYNRVPIEFYDEKNYGCGADSLRARVIFRGYAPKNTYYYLKTLKPYKRKPRKSNQAIQSSSASIPQQQKHQPQTIQQTSSSSSTIKNENDIKFESKFESGNLSAASRISANQYWLYMRQDTNTHGLRQWYYFTVSNKKICRIKFRIYGFTKSYSLYKMGMKPYIRHSMMADFHQGGDKVKYQYDNLQKGYFLEFQFKFEEDFMEVQFAMLPPYTYSMMKQFLRGLQTLQPNPNKQHSPQTNSTPIQQPIPSKQPNLTIQTTVIGQSLSGLTINLLKIKKERNKNQRQYKNEYKYEQKQRQCIIILSRTHPGQTVSNYALQSFIYTVLNDPSVIEYYDFFIIPMVNPDGVYFGNHRTSIIGQDLNRNFHTQDFDVFPQIQAVNNVINIAKKTHKIRYLLDLHGHSARKNIFAYGPQHQINTPQYLHSRILPKLLNDALSSFKYDYCVFRQSKQKKNTARVHFTNNYKINCLTFQQSYGIVDNQVIGVQHWRNFGIALANSLLELAQMYKQGKQRALQAYLAEETEKEKLMLEKRYEKHRKMLGLTQFIPMAQQKDVELDRKNKTQTAIKLETQNKNKSELTQSQKKDSIQIYQSLNNEKNNTLHEQNIIEQRDKQQKQDIQKQQQQQQQQRYGQQQQLSQDASVNSSMLSSGDQSLQLHNDQIEQIKKQIIKIGCLKQGLKRQKYNIADKKLQLFDASPNQDMDTNKDPHTHRQNISTYRRLHEQKSSMIPRIAKLQQKRKDDYNLSFKRQFREDRRDIIEKERLERKKEIQAKFRRMELPSIKK